ncbi:MAG: FAD binding domain-containing protein [Candidatus Aceula meridiana]|nr:FAD binding domain-containing protein [Candidatus Aceula meridiana]
MLLNPFTYHAPSSVKQAAKLYATLADVKILAGGTIVLNTLKKLKQNGAKTPENIISLKKIKALQTICTQKSIITIGSMATCRDIIHSKELKKDCPLLIAVAQNIATTQIRNMATIGGNITGRFTWTEFQTPLVALDAKLHFVTKTGKEKIINAESFFKQNAKTSDILEKITFKAPQDVCFVYKRIPKRAEPDIPIFSICLRASVKKGTFQNVCVAINNAKSFARKDTKIEKTIAKLKTNDKAGTNLLKTLDLSRYAKDGDYKQAVISSTLKNTLNELIAQTK